MAGFDSHHSTWRRKQVARQVSMRAIDQSFSRRYASGSHGRRGGKAAFTLVEILMVVIILGIASAVIVPNLGTRNDMNVAAAARVVMADLMYAQNRAIVTQSMTYVQF